jgi:hypothetical protein
MATEQQVFSEHSVEFGKYDKIFWNWSGDNSLVPAVKLPQKSIKVLKGALKLRTITLVPYRFELVYNSRT